MSYSSNKSMLTNPSTSSDLINELPGHLLTKILSKLPCKYVVQCKAVCKRWLRLITEPDFVQIFIHRQQQLHQRQYNCLNFIHQYYTTSLRPGVRRHELKSTSSIPHTKALLSNEPHILKFVPCFRQEDTIPIQVVACFNDLIVCCGDRLFQGIYYICNPITKQWLKLPPAPDCDEKTMVGFVCYPPNQAISTSNNVWCSSCSFKLVLIPKLRSFPNKFTVQIFCSESGKWSQSEVFSSQGSSSSIFWWDGIVACNGILHWMNGRQSIAAYDPKNNVNQCRMIDPPTDSNPEAPSKVPFQCLGVCGERLRVSKLYALPFMDSRNYPLSVWELEDYSEGKWRLVYKICIKDIVLEDPCLMKEIKLLRWSVVSMLAFHPIDPDIAYLHFKRWLVSYNLRSRTLQVICELQCDFVSWINFFPVVYYWWPTPIPPLREN